MTGSRLPPGDMFHSKRPSNGNDNQHHGTFNPMTAHGSRYGGSGTIGGMSELSYSISDAGTHAHMTASGISGMNPPNLRQTTRVDQCLDDFLGDVVVGHN